MSEPDRLADRQHVPVPTDTRLQGYDPAEDPPARLAARPDGTWPPGYQDGIASQHALQEGATSGDGTLADDGEGAQAGRLAQGEGGHGDWTASEAGIGQRRGPAADAVEATAPPSASGPATDGTAPQDAATGDPPRDDTDAPPRPRADVPQDSPTARDEARGRRSEPLPGASGKSG